MRSRSSVLAVLLLASACGSFKDSGSADGGRGGDSSAPGDGAAGADGGQADGPGGHADSSTGGSDGGGDGGRGPTDSGPIVVDGGGDGAAATGPGPLGALPSGYCCTSDADCRNRNCVDLGGGNRMCEDECDGAQSECDGIVPGFTCQWDDSGTIGTCQPPTPSTACIPADQYVHGTKPTGACCTATGNATAGQECLGGLCISFGSTSNPYICTNACSPGSCPGSYSCSNVGLYDFCAMLTDPYTCQ